MKRVNRARRDIWHATYLGVVERVHGLGRHGEILVKWKIGVVERWSGRAVAQQREPAESFLYRDQKI